jgi:hypothetical protein
MASKENLPELSAIVVWVADGWSGGAPFGRRVTLAFSTGFKSTAIVEPSKVAGSCETAAVASSAETSSWRCICDVLPFETVVRRSPIIRGIDGGWGLGVNRQLHML